MNIQHGDTRYWTTFVEDRKAGCSGFRQNRECRGQATDAGQVLFWDATGGFVFETMNGDVPVEIVQAAIAEAKEKIETN